MQRTACVLVVAFVGLTACGRTPGVFSEASPTLASTPAPSASSSPSPTAKPSPVELATDSYPSAPSVNSGYLGNGVYGNALLVDDGGVQTATWYWDGKAWRRPAASEPAYFSTRPVFDPALRVSVALAGGATGDGFTTWAWNGTRWLPLGGGPPGDGPALLGFDSATNQLIALIGNTTWTATSTWVFDGRAWQHAGGPKGPQARWAAGMAYDSSTRQLVVHGGIASQGRRIPLTDTWTWDGKTWTEHHPKNNPPAGWDSLAYDPDSHQMILVNVSVPDENSPPTEISMWSWDGANWHRLNPDRMPAIGTYPSLTYDLANRVLILFEGTFGASTNLPGSQTWTLAQNTWKRVG